MSTTATATMTETVPTAVSLDSGVKDEKEVFQALFRGDRQGKITRQGIPTFTDPLEERKWMKQHMAAAFRFFAKNGYSEGVSGHISMRGTSRASPSIAAPISHEVRRSVVNYALS
jgi:hypothetical protein